MKPRLAKFAVVTATTSAARSKDCLLSWKARATYDWEAIVVYNGNVASRGPHLGVVPAFAQGVASALEKGADLIVCLHDDVLMEEDGWDEKVVSFFDAHPACGLAGFGGGVNLGADNIYQVPYKPEQLARGDFISNMRDAELHGRRVVEATRVSCLDGFSQVGRRDYWEGLPQDIPNTAEMDLDTANLFQRLATLGLVHHAYDAALGAYAARLGWETWMLPIQCHHYGGRTAVADQAYHAWARTQDMLGDVGFWENAHDLVYREFRDVLPLHRGMPSRGPT